MEVKDLFSVKEAAQYLGVSQSAISRLEKQGLLSSTRTSGGRRHFSREGIENYILNTIQKETIQKDELNRIKAKVLEDPKASYITEPSEKNELFLTSESCVDIQCRYFENKGHKRKFH